MECMGGGEQISEKIEKMADREEKKTYDTCLLVKNILEKEGETEVPGI